MTLSECDDSCLKKESKAYLDSDYEIRGYTYRYSSSYGLEKDTFIGLVETTVGLYNEALYKWNAKLEGLGYPTLR